MVENLEILTLLGNQFLAEYIKNITKQIDKNLTVINFTQVIDLVDYLKNKYKQVLLLVLDSNYKNVFDLIKAVKHDEDTSLIRIITVIDAAIDNQNFLYEIYCNGGHYFLNLKYAEDIEIRTILENAINDGKNIRLLKLETLFDPLTRVFNRRGLMSAFKNMFSYAQSMIKENIMPVIFMIGFLDIDNFKFINDTYGHKIGDVYLQNLCDKINSIKRNQDIFGRYGGEEFCLGLFCNNVDSGVSVFENIRQAIENMEVVWKNVLVKTTVSIGVSCLQPNDEHYLNILQRADKAVYIAKNKGKNRVETQC
ncbi:MAG: GGDEF domain-containing protein [Desulfurella sp.]|jgi:two-component system cell cycle response regulator